MSDLVEAVKALHHARQNEAVWKAVVKGAREAFEASIASDVAYLTALAALRESAEIRVRELAVEAFKATGSKAPTPGVTVAEMTKLHYEAKDAFAWALEKKFCLSLDTKMFESTAKATMDKAPLPFVTVELVPQAKVATDLSEAVKVVE